MARFPNQIIVEAWHRQRGKCGDCGKNFMNEGLAYEGHHLKRIADGGSNNDINNCVLLCEECHYVVHNYGKYRDSLMFYPSDFKNFRG